MSNPLDYQPDSQCINTNYINLLRVAWFWNVRNHIYPSSGDSHYLPKETKLSLFVDVMWLEFLRMKCIGIKIVPNMLRNLKIWLYLCVQLHCLYFNVDQTANFYFIDQDTPLGKSTSFFPHCWSYTIWRNFWNHMDTTYQCLNRRANNIVSTYDCLI